MNPERSGSRPIPGLETLVHGIPSEEAVSEAFYLFELNKGGHPSVRGIFSNMEEFEKCFKKTDHECRFPKKEGMISFSVFEQDVMAVYDKPADVCRHVHVKLQSLDHGRYFLFRSCSSWVGD